MKYRQLLVSLMGFALVVGGLAYVDPRVRDHFSRLVSGGDGIASWDNRLMDLGGVLAVGTALSKHRERTTHDLCRRRRRALSLHGKDVDLGARPGCRA